MCTQEAECEKAKMDTKYKADAAIADSSREFKMQKAHFDSEVNTKVNIQTSHLSADMSVPRLELWWVTMFGEIF